MMPYDADTERTTRPPSRSCLLFATTDTAVTHRDTSSSPSCSHDTPLQRFGATLRQYRKQRRLSQQALAARTGIRRAYISDIELGKRNISVLTLLHLAQVLRIPSSWLLVGLDAHTALPPPGTCAPGSSSAGQEAGGSPDAPPTVQRDLHAILLARLRAAIRQYRQQRGLFQAALATLTDLTPKRRSTQGSRPTSSRSRGRMRLPGVRSSNPAGALDTAGSGCTPLVALLCPMAHGSREPHTGEVLNVAMIHGMEA
jgi:HTH-type transcriptional regulator, competence development regulator